MEDDDERESGEEETRRDGADKQDKYSTSMLSLLTFSTRLPSIPIYQDHVFCAAKSVVQFHLHS